MASNTQVFGVSLAEVMTRPTEKTIPTFIKKVVRYLNAEAISTEGLFRISPKQQVLDEIMKKIDSGEDVDFFQYSDHHLIAGLLKTYLRALPEPLLGFALYTRFIDAAAEYEKQCSVERARGAMMATDAAVANHTNQYVDQLGALIDQLPAPNKAFAEILLLFLSRVAEHSAKNKMNSTNLAIVFGQLLLRPQEETVESMMSSSKVTGITKIMIDKFDEIFPKQKAKVAQNNPVEPTAGLPDKDEDATDQTKADQEKLQRIKETVDDAIVLVQKKLTNLSVQLKETESLDVAIEIARRVRTAKKVLFVDANGKLDGSRNLDLKRKRKRKKKGGGNRIGIESGFESLQGKRKTMEDEHKLIEDMTTLYPQLPADQQWSYFAVYDGHGGELTAKICGEVLHAKLAENASFAEGKIIEALESAFLETDRHIIEQGQQKGFKDGSTAVVAVIHNNTLYTANAGDSEVILVRKTGDAFEHVVLSEKHKATNPDEKARIEKAGGAVFGGRVFGTLAVSRSLGDRDFKIPTSEANFVSAEPYTQTVPLTENDRWVLLACDGLWDKFSYEKAVEFVEAKFDEGKTAQEVSALLANEAIEQGSLDNVTIVIVKLLF